MLNRHMVWMLRVLLSTPVSLQGAALADAVDIHSIANIPLPAEKDCNSSLILKLHSFI